MKYYKEFPRGWIFSNVILTWPSFDFKNALQCAADWINSDLHAAWCTCRSCELAGRTNKASKTLMNIHGCNHCATACLHIQTYIKQNTTCNYRQGGIIWVGEEKFSTWITSPLIWPNVGYIYLKSASWSGLKLFMHFLCVCGELNFVSF